MTATRGAFRPSRKRASGTFASASATTSARSGPPARRVTPRTSASGTASSAVPSAIEVPLPGASASEGCGLHSPQRLRSLAVTRAAFAMLNVAAPAIIPPVVDAAPARMSASDATLNEAAESSTPAPSDMNAAMARCRRCVSQSQNRPDKPAGRGSHPPAEGPHRSNEPFRHCVLLFSIRHRHRASGEPGGPRRNRSHWCLEQFLYSTAPRRSLAVRAEALASVIKLSSTCCDCALHLVMCQNCERRCLTHTLGIVTGTRPTGMRTTTALPLSAAIRARGRSCAQAAKRDASVQPHSARRQVPQRVWACGCRPQPGPIHQARSFSMQPTSSIGW